MPRIQHDFSPVSGLILLVMLLLLMLSSCEEIVSNVDIPEPEKKLVVCAFLNPEDTVTEVTVSKSVPVLGKLNNGTPDYVPDATVIISEGSQQITLVFDPGSKTYKTTGLQVNPGATYHLLVTAPGGFQVSSVCTVPAKLNTSLSISLDSVPQDFTRPDSLDYFVKAKWQDLAGAGDYYRVAAEMYLELNTGPSGFEQLAMEEALFTDQNGDGRLYKSESVYPPTLRQYYITKELKSIHAYLLTTDQHYYKYHESLRRHQLGDTFSEPVFVYTNIEGGLGVFCAYRRHSLVFQP